MATAADYLRIDTTQLVSSYKLRSRSVGSLRFVATNVATNYSLAVSITPNEGAVANAVIVTPSSFRLQPNQAITVTVQFDINQLETLTAGTISDTLDINVSATPLIEPVIPDAPPALPLPPDPPAIKVSVKLVPDNFTLLEVGETKQYIPTLFVDGTINRNVVFTWALHNNNSNAFSIDADTGIVKLLQEGRHTAIVEATVVAPALFAGIKGLANVSGFVRRAIIEDVPPAKGNLDVVVEGLPNSIDANVQLISNADPTNPTSVNTITRSITISNIFTGAYTVTPGIVSFRGEFYDPSGGGQVTVSPNQTQQVRIVYTKREVPVENTYQLEILQPANGTVVTLGQSFTVTVQTRRNNQTAALGPINITATNTQEGVLSIEPSTSGYGTATFRAITAGIADISVTNQFAGAASTTVRIREEERLVTGCTDPNALNFNPLAEVDDNSCIPKVFGCTDPRALNYNPRANTEDITNPCNYEVRGCTDRRATNYNPRATADDGTCQYIEEPIRGCTDRRATNYNPRAAVDDGSCEFIRGCTDQDAQNYNPRAIIDDGSCVKRPVLGCTDRTARNWNPAATVDDGTCEFEIGPPRILGCTDPLAKNFNPRANVPDDSCIYDIPGCTDPRARNFDMRATIDNGTCAYDVRGCTNSLAINYNPAATLDDGSCIICPPAGSVISCVPIGITSNGSQQQYVVSISTGTIINGVCGTEFIYSTTCDGNRNDGNQSPPPIIYGCMDPSALNYNRTATSNEGIVCVYNTDGSGTGNNGDRGGLLSMTTEQEL